MRIWCLLLGLCLVGPGISSAAQAVVPDPRWQVARAQFTSGIKNREPVDRVVVATPQLEAVYFFTDLRNLAGRTVTHRWRYEGKPVSLVPFQVGGDRWRVYSKKVIDPEQVGEWSVTVLDESGWPLYTELFRYGDGAPLLQPADASAASVQRIAPRPGVSLQPQESTGAVSSEAEAASQNNGSTP